MHGSVKTAPLRPSRLPGLAAAPRPNPQASDARCNELSTELSVTRDELARTAAVASRVAATEHKAGLKVEGTVTMEQHGGSARGRWKHCDAELAQLHTLPGFGQVLQPTISAAACLQGAQPDSPELSSSIARTRSALQCNLAMQPHSS